MCHQHEGGDSIHVTNFGAERINEAYRLKSEGPRADPCGTPYKTAKLKLGKTFWRMYLQLEENQSRAVPEKKF